METPPKSISVDEFLVQLDVGKYRHPRAMRIDGIVDGKRILKELEDFWRVNISTSGTVLPGRFALTSRTRRDRYVVMRLLEVTATRIDCNDVRRMINAIYARQIRDEPETGGRTEWRVMEESIDTNQRIRSYESYAIGVARLAQLMRCRRIPSDVIVEWIAPMSLKRM